MSFRIEYDTTPEVDVSEFFPDYHKTTAILLPDGEHAELHFQSSAGGTYSRMRVRIDRAFMLNESLRKLQPATRGKK